MIKLTRFLPPSLPPLPPLPCPPLPPSKVYRINYRFGILYINGAVPGHKNTYVRVTDAKRVPHTSPPPFPTFIPSPDSPPLPEEAYSAEVHASHEPSLTFPATLPAKKK